MVKKVSQTLFSHYPTRGTRSICTKKQKDSTNHKISHGEEDHQGGIGAIGSAKASYFHPDKHINTEFPNDYKTLRLENVTIVSDGMARVNHKEQHCYFINIKGIDSILHIIVKFFWVNQATAVIFEAERRVTDLPAETVATRAGNEAEETRRSQQNVSANVTYIEEIAKLLGQYIKVDNDNEPAPKNAWSPPSPVSTVQWINLPSVLELLMSRFPTMKENGNNSLEMKLRKCANWISFAWYSLRIILQVMLSWQQITTLPSLWPFKNSTCGLAVNSSWHASKELPTAKNGGPRNPSLADTAPLSAWPISCRRVASSKSQQPLSTQTNHLLHL